VTLMSFVRPFAVIRSQASDDCSRRRRPPAPRSLQLLERKVDGLHVGGKSALDWHGVRQYVSQQNKLHLYGWTATKARELAEGAYTLRAGVLEELLKRCTSVKTVRLCLLLGRELSLPWAKKLNPAQLPTGSKKPWVSRSADGLLILKP
jgi:hypothetical protein